MRGVLGDERGANVDALLRVLHRFRRRVGRVKHVVDNGAQYKFLPLGEAALEEVGEFRVWLAVRLELDGGGEVLMPINVSLRKVSGG